MVAWDTSYKLIRLATSGAEGSREQIPGKESGAQQRWGGGGGIVEQVEAEGD